MKQYDYLIVGAGLFGAVFAHEAKKAGKKCLVIDKRDHIAGNIYTEAVEGINVHRYGAHALPGRGMVPIPPPDSERLAHRGCPFYPRCAQAMARCGAERPGDMERPGGGKVRCFLYA